MWVECRKCAKNLSCHKPIGYRFGGCNVDYEPKEVKLPDNPVAVMQWKQLSSTQWEAKGKLGKFLIERSGGKFWSRYASADTAFKLPPKLKLNDAKSMCEDNINWE